MKGYNLCFDLRWNKYQKSRFIKKYKVDKETSKLIISYLDNSIEVLTYDKNKLNNIRCTMERQYQKYNELSKYHREFCIENHMFILSGSLLSNFLIFNQSLVSEISLLLTSSLLSADQIYWIIRSILDNKELSKQKFYLDNTKYFSDYTLNKYRLDQFLSKKELSLLQKSKNETESYFNLSSIDNYSIKTLKKIKNLIENDNYCKVKKR